MSAILGVDPGATGALALIVDDELVAVEDMPAIDKRVNAANVGRLINDWRALYGLHVAAIENVHAMPRDGAVAAFSFGRALGVVEGVVLAAGIPVTWVAPNVWKKAMGLTKRPDETPRQAKNRSRQLATDVWPTWGDTFKRVKDADRAEAALIARWAATQ